MKSRTLTNVLLVVIAVGTLGNFFGGEAKHNPALAVLDSGEEKAAIPVYIVAPPRGVEVGAEIGPGNGLKVVILDEKGSPLQWLPAEEGRAPQPGVGVQLPKDTLFWSFNDWAAWIRDKVPAGQWEATVRGLVDSGTVDPSNGDWIKYKLGIGPLP